jgi:hypothetical protein
VTGTVPDVRPWLAGADLVVAPLLIARGVQNKVLEAMAMARPVLATRARPPASARVGQDLAVADGPEDFATHTMALLDAALARSMGAAGRLRGRPVRLGPRARPAAGPAGRRSQGIAMRPDAAPLSSIQRFVLAVPESWRRPLLFVATAWLGVFALFAGDWRDMALQWWDSSTYNHALLIPLILGWLVWLRTGGLLRLTPSAWWPGLLPFAGACFLWMLGDFPASAGAATGGGGHAAGERADAAGAARGRGAGVSAVLHAVPGARRGRDDPDAADRDGQDHDAAAVRGGAPPRSTACSSPPRAATSKWPKPVRA